MMPRSRAARGLAGVTLVANGFARFDAGTEPEQDWEVWPHRPSRPGQVEGGGMRSIGSVAAKNRCSRNRLTDEEVRLIASLHTQYKRFLRLGAEREDWLTPDVHRNFGSAVAALVPKVDTGKCDLKRPLTSSAF